MSDKKWANISSDEPESTQVSAKPSDSALTKPTWSVPSWLTPSLVTFVVVATILVVLQPGFVEIRNKDPMVAGRICWIRVLVISLISAVIVLVYPKVSSWLMPK